MGQGALITDGDHLGTRTTDVLYWAEWFENTEKNRRLALTETECCQLSTVFLGLDHQFRQRPATTVRNIGLSEGRRDR